ncbi:hypothetical protein EDB81DRAFT_842429 [Dactylonectria macrodidyma]|uniref:Uncharacterized protein n=1 Tax=Dactylonectria macrodidyma TaxID=307937 RepID=A0A9P9J7J2_9HYPO|nr:hypothetical protein EDB81DRAFT_842429 [Dactylonectria macrodidyma]
MPAIDGDFLDGLPSTTRSDFEDAKLRRFPGCGSEIQWLEFLGYGREGLVFKVTFGHGDPVALKVFWRAKRPAQPVPRSTEPMILDWPFEDECITAALLDQMKRAMADDDAKAAAGATRTIATVPGPRTVTEAIRNICAFSDEARQSPRTGAKHSHWVYPPPFPPVPNCYGWTTIHRDQIPFINPPVRSVVDDVDWHWAIVYELVPAGAQDISIGQLHLDFFYAVGLALGPYKCDNWHGGRLVDLNDIRTPYGIGWNRSLVRPRVANKWFLTLDCTQPYALAYKIVEPSERARRRKLARLDSGHKGSETGAKNNTDN